MITISYPLETWLNQRRNGWYRKFWYSARTHTHMHTHKYTGAASGQRHAWMWRHDRVCCLLSLLHLCPSLLPTLSLTTKSNLSRYPPPFLGSGSSQDHSLIKTWLPENYGQGAEPEAGGCSTCVCVCLERCPCSCCPSFVWTWVLGSFTKVLHKNFRKKWMFWIH